ncbi:UBC-like protein [Aureobasidium sp. EXF-10727]|nr:UBC-like protein [Aureobasidium sp. EXF-10727]
MANKSSTIRILRARDKGTPDWLGSVYVCPLPLPAELSELTVLALAVAHLENDVSNVRCLILGPSDTPYEFGFFEFKVKIGPAYPVQPPSVRCLTTNNGRCRFNPNIYASGKVCLSILGTWRGEPGEQWSTAQGLESVLISIQSLMSCNPYENEPGFENIKITDTEAEAYAQKIRHETLRITVLQRLEQLLQISNDDHSTTAMAVDTPPADYDDDGVKEYDPSADEKDGSTEPDFCPFGDLYKRRFLWYYDAYIRSIDDASAKIKDGKQFEHTPFEYSGNDMRGKYAYASLKIRFQRVWQALEAEKDIWAKNGKQVLTDQNGTALNLQHQFESLRSYYSQSNGPSIEISLVDANPFVWILTFFDPNESDLYGATINVRIHFPFEFPEEQPRVTVLTPLFHHRISATTKTLCYFPTKLYDVENHIESIMATIIDETPSYDPRTLVNPAASALLWGDENGKKMYRRKLRRSVQDAMESCDEW